MKSARITYQTLQHNIWTLSQPFWLATCRQNHHTQRPRTGGRGGVIVDVSRRRSSRSSSSSPDLARGVDQRPPYQYFLHSWWAKLKLIRLCVGRASVNSRTPAPNWRASVRESCRNPSGRHRTSGLRTCACTRARGKKKSYTMWDEY